MDQILAIRPFVPAKDFDVSKRFYRALGFTLTHEDESIAILKLGSSAKLGHESRVHLRSFRRALARG